MDRVHNETCGDHTFASGSVGDGDEGFRRTNEAAIAFVGVSGLPVRLSGKLPQVVRPMRIDVLRCGEDLGVGCDAGGVVDAELQANFACIEEAAVVPAVDSTPDDGANQGFQPRCLGIFPPCCVGDLACTAQHVAAVIAARGSVLVEEFGFSVENELHGFAVSVDGVLGHVRKLSMVVPGNVGQSRAESGIANGWHELGEDCGLVAPEIGRNHASSPTNDGQRAVGLRLVFGLEVDLCNSKEQSKDADRGLVSAFFF